ncbi:MAG: tripartite tricarboxylate transporter substrate binding protein [Hyphomicrobiales bacterium]
MNRRQHLLRLAALPLAAMAAPARAQPIAFPSRPVKIIVPYGPGTTSDAISRMLAKRLSDAWGQSVVVENLVGAGGVVGTQAIARAAPDGHTVGMIASNFAISAAVFPKLPYDSLRDFKPIVHVTFNQFVFVVNPALPARDVRELIALAKERPGHLDFASSGNGGSPHLAMEMFASMAGIKLNHVPYRATGQAVTDVVSGQVQLMCTSISTLAPFIRDGRLRALAVSGSKRSPLLPDVPTMSEAGVPGYVMKNWNGIVAPASVSDEVAARLQADIVRIVQEPAFETQLTAQAAEVEVLGPSEFGKRIADEIDLWRRVVLESGAKVE